MEESCNPHFRVREQEADGNICEPASRADCTATIRWQAGLFAGKSPSTSKLRYFPWSYTHSPGKSPLALCLEAYVQQPVPEHVAKPGVGDLLPFVWTCPDPYCQCRASISSHWACSIPARNLITLEEGQSPCCVKFRKVRGVEFLLFIQIFN